MFRVNQYINYALSRTALCPTSCIVAVILALTLGGCGQANKIEASTGAVNPNFLSASGKQADPNDVINLPKDHQAHSDFDIEWWYLTANLQDESGEAYAFQWTLFRFSNVSLNNAWHQQQTFMAHTSMHTPEQHWFEERFAAGGVGNAMVGLIAPISDKRATFEGSSPQNDAEDKKSGKVMSLMLDDWQWTAHKQDGSLFPATLSASVTKSEGNSERRVSMRFDMTPSGPFVLQGEQGYSVKSAKGKHASHYYSLPFIDVSGTLSTAEGDTQLSGKAWYDHEWTSTLLDQSTAGWDWMSLHFDNGDKLMAFSMRLNDQENYQTGTFIRANGESNTLLPKDISLDILRYTDVDERSLPLHWRVSIPSQSVDIQVTAMRENAYNPSIFGYYEGDVEIKGSHRGIGFLELTGY